MNEVRGHYEEHVDLIVSGRIEFTTFLSCNVRAHQQKSPFKEPSIPASLGHLQGWLEWAVLKPL
jgi:hypothetical protein